MLRVAELKRQGFKWFVWVYDGHPALAINKSNARADLKRRLGLKRLPAGAKVELVEGFTP